MTAKLTDVSSRYGAPMGRVHTREAPEEGELCNLHRIDLDQGGYDSGGAYWGIGQPLYRMQSAAGDSYIRATSRFDAWQRFCERFKMQIRVRP